MASRLSVNRPPTPEPEVRERRDEPMSLREVVDAKLLESGEKERLKTLLRDRLEECGWSDDLLVYARAYVSKVGRDNISLDELIRAITPKGRASVPGPVKAELLQRIQSFLTAK
ncbi:hypothetical protein CLOM_g9892 [Closterium sp. NIES-68]|nr:hypothetical protein CLOM_g9892 [Closterium sp. NIES-68]GJP75915.1 hypothetical protein CLOP_g6315 [Closterium sp. NIES-67]